MGILRICFDKLFPLPDRFVFQYVHKRIPTIISHGFAITEFSALMLRHRLDAHIFNTDNIIAVCNRAGLFVLEITALVWQLGRFWDNCRLFLLQNSSKTASDFKQTPQQNSTISAVVEHESTRKENV